MKKKLIVAALISAMIFALVACGSSKPVTTASLPTPTGQGTNVTPSEPQKATTSSGLKTLGKYRGIEVEKLALDVSDDDVNINFYLSLTDEAVLNADAVVKLYDYVNIDFVGKMNGELFEGGSSDPEEGGSNVLIGSQSFIPGFEEGIIGMKTGETKTVKVTFPEEYKAELAGKDAEFDITVNSVKVFPEITDEMVAAHTEFETVAAFKADIRSQLEEQAASTIEKQFQSDLFDKLIENCEFDSTIIQPLVDEASTSMKSNYEMTAMQYGMDFETFVLAAFGMTMDVFNKEIVAAAEYNVKLEKAFIAIAEAEKYTVTEEEYAAYVNTIIANYGFESREAVEALYTPEYIKEGMMIEKAQEIVKDSAVAKETKQN